MLGVLVFPPLLRFLQGRKLDPIMFSIVDNRRPAVTDLAREDGMQATDGKRTVIHFGTRKRLFGTKTVSLMTQFTFASKLVCKKESAPTMLDFLAHIFCSF